MLQTLDTRLRSSRRLVPRPRRPDVLALSRVVQGPAGAPLCIGLTVLAPLLQFPTARHGPDLAGSLRPSRSPSASRSSPCTPSRGRTSSSSPSFAGWACSCRPPPASPWWAPSSGPAAATPSAWAARSSGSAGRSGSRRAGRAPPGHLHRCRGSPGRPVPQAGPRRGAAVRRGFGTELGGRFVGMSARGTGCGRGGQGRAGSRRDDRRARSRPGRGAGARAGVRRVPHRPPLPRGRRSTTTSRSCSATRPRASSRRSGATSPTSRPATSSSSTGGRRAASAGRAAGAGPGTASPPTTRRRR